MVKRLFIVLFICLSICIPKFAEAVENCALRSYLAKNPKTVPETIALGEVSSVPSPREVSFQVPVTGSAAVTVTRLLPTESMSPRLQELFNFSNSQNIVIAKGAQPQLPSSRFIGVPDEALRSEEALSLFITNALKKNDLEVPLDINRLPTASQALVVSMREQHNTNFIFEGNDLGMNHNLQNKIGIRESLPENLRVNSTVTHEITHNTTDRKILEIFNPSTGSTAKPLTSILSGREMNITPKPGKELDLPQSIEGYDRYYRSDEIEAHLREIARSQHDGVNFDSSLRKAKSFIDFQEKQLNALLKNNGSELKIVTEKVTDTDQLLGAGRRQRRDVTTDNVDFTFHILVPIGLSTNGEARFIESTLKNRLQVIQNYRRSLERYQGQ